MKCHWDGGHGQSSLSEELVNILSESIHCSKSALSYLTKWSQVLVHFKDCISPDQWCCWRAGGKWQGRGAAASWHFHRRAKLYEMINKQTTITTKQPPTNKQKHAHKKPLVFLFITFESLMQNSQKSIEIFPLTSLSFRSSCEWSFRSI